MDHPILHTIQGVRRAAPIPRQRLRRRRTANTLLKARSSTKPANSHLRVLTHGGTKFTPPFPAIGGLSAIVNLRPNLSPIRQHPAIGPNRRATHRNRVIDIAGLKSARNQRWVCRHVLGAHSGGVGDLVSRVGKVVCRSWGNKRAGAVLDVPGAHRGLGARDLQADRSRNPRLGLRRPPWCSKLTQARGPDLEAATLTLLALRPSTREEVLRSRVRPSTE